MTRYRAKTGAHIPMPDRPGQQVPEDGEGTSVNELNPYYLRLIADGDLVPVTDEMPAAPVAEKTGKASASREGTS
ncbi:hypothetical protein AncyloWKF20_05150 [Ancylobacter sp. WKF20]|uniref:hypothetical protein n=1 Tax=Ancylobacter sp. WKF20 TaxID=3039801 RepID=UPI0024342CE4|nr:hypothetical protein [Ancylobacter sp. WKF20]WGD31211.1 hypothetical protein AncyloWKF20_05150 [Ancylobacter sp. WKF20]